MKYKERRIDADICETCPARNGYQFQAHLRGSSFRERKIEETDSPHIDNCLIIMGNLVVGNVQIANQMWDKAAAEQDADYVYATFENEIDGCRGPTSEITSSGLQTFCTPLNTAVTEFIRINYKGA